MTPRFLKFADQATAEAQQWLQRDKDGNVLPDGTAPFGFYHVVGTIYTPAVMDGMKVVTPAVAQAGYHVNVLADPARWPAGLNPFLVDPVTPCSIFGGMPSVRPAWGWGEKPEGWVE